MNNNDHSSSNSNVDFGYQKVAPRQKTELVDDVFKRVADRYDVMNDLMSFGTHRVFKRMLVEMAGLRTGHRVLDLAGGTGDVSALLASLVGSAGQVVLTDPNPEMIRVGRDRLLDQGLAQVEFCQAYGEALPFADESFDAASISFGLRNFTSKHEGLTEILRVLKPGAALVVLEFSKPSHPALDAAYGLFQNLWPGAGQVLVGDSQPYQYLVESIRVHPDQKALKLMFEDAGFTDVVYHDLIGGIAAIHRGTKPL
ncbi:MAG: class I SAM-dependent methyltransferase [Pseudomonadota bacterium]